VIIGTGFGRLYATQAFNHAAFQLIVVVLPAHKHPSHSPHSPSLSTSGNDFKAPLLTSTVST
jgi:hypothetical protein